eukprot:TRINITY_DN82575_c0_g1_i1.p1 TRINITY_DN82575_c0_g1~~TRINITY_DN82575_c0_g1_i1.p1  ORF type:complete len:792 (+),score=119.96 TRINITY_DN82575_c0_g1_i1:270-2378(+)
MMGSLHPAGALYEKSVSVEQCRRCLRSLVGELTEAGVTVLSIGDILRMGQFLDDRQRLEDLAMSCIKYSFSNQGGHLTGQEYLLLSEDYKRSAVADLDTYDLIDAIITRPTVTLVKSAQNTALTTTSLQFQPLTNLVFTRDQMIATAKGAVLSSLNSVQRGVEVDIVRCCLDKLKIPVLGQIPLPGKLEGGDFYPAGKDLCFIGLGIRTNSAAIEFMLRNKWFGTRRVAVVQDLFERRQARMHLDCVFNIAGDDLVCAVENILGADNPNRRLVVEYTLIGDKYVRTVEHMELSQYLAANGFTVLPISERMANNYGLNFINVGQSRIVTTDEETAAHISDCPQFKGTVKHINFREITKLYGAIHCATQVFRVPTESRPTTAAATQVAKEEVIILGEDAPPVQTTGTVLMVAPTYFHQNTETLTDNSFMQAHTARNMHTLDQVSGACRNFAQLYTLLQQNGIKVHLFHHEQYHATPDAVFPNNWFSTHHGGSLVLYPMKHPSRQRERRRSILEFLRSKYPKVVDLTNYENQEDEDATIALEGTGAMVLDRVNRIAYAMKSGRCSPQALDAWCKQMGYRPVLFEGTASIYHTNVMMHVGSTMAIVCDAWIKPDDRKKVLSELRQSGKTVIKASKEQAQSFACNCLELRTPSGANILVMSSQAYNSLTEEQLYLIQQHVSRVIHVDFGVIEMLAGGGVRCAIAELF